MSYTQREVVKKLYRDGWIPTGRGKGSHVVVQKSGYPPITIPKGEIKRGTLRGIISDSGLTPEQFEAL